MNGWQYCSECNSALPVDELCLRCNPQVAGIHILMEIHKAIVAELQEECPHKQKMLVCEVTLLQWGGRTRKQQVHRCLNCNKIL